MADYQNHFLTWIASVFCFLGIVSLLFLPVKKTTSIYRSATFLPTYTLGIFAWLLYGLEVGSSAIIYPCAIQIVVLFVLIKRSLHLKSENLLFDQGPDEL